MLRSSNPILSRQDAFTPAAQQYNQNPYNQSRADAPYPSQGYPPAPVEPFEARMSFDDVVTKTALTIGVLVITAALAWMFVVTRMVHAGIHVTSNDVRWRFQAFAVGAMLLLIMWIVFALRVLSSGA